MKLDLIFHKGEKLAGDSKRTGKPYEFYPSICSTTLPDGIPVSFRVNFSKDQFILATKHKKLTVEMKANIDNNQNFSLVIDTDSIKFPV